MINKNSWVNTPVTSTTKIGMILRGIRPLVKAIMLRPITSRAMPVLVLISASMIIIDANTDATTKVSAAMVLKFFIVNKIKRLEPCGGVEPPLAPCMVSFRTSREGP